MNSFKHNKTYNRQSTYDTSTPCPHVRFSPDAETELDRRNIVSDSMADINDTMSDETPNGE